MPILRNQLADLTDQLLAWAPGVQPPLRRGRTRSALEGVVASERGSVTVEYAVLLTLVSLGCVFAVIGLGVPLVRMYEATQIWLRLPLP